MLKTSITNASNYIFPGLIHHSQREGLQNLGNEVKSNLPLQIALYFNVWIFPIWFFVLLFDIDEKYYNLSDAYKFITVALFLVISVLEGARLYLGYRGNLQEKIPELASFWLLSTLIQFPLEIFLLLYNNTRLQFTKTIISGMMVFLLTIEIITGTKALKNSADYHAKRFYIAQLYGINN